MTLARETLTKCIGDVDEIKEKLLPKNGNRKQRMSDFLQFILQYDDNVIEFKRMLKRNGLQDLLREVDREIDAFRQDIGKFDYNIVLYFTFELNKYNIEYQVCCIVSHGYCNKFT